MVTKLITVDTTNKVSISGDGVTWDYISTASLGGNYAVSLVYAPEIGTFVLSGYFHTASSQDAIDWTTPSDISGGHVAWAPELGLFISSIITGLDKGKVATSPDGIEWTVHNTGSSDDKWCAVWSPELGLAVVVGYDDSATSTDGVVWTLHNNVSHVDVQRLIWVSSLSLFVGIGPGGVQTSPDGIVWSWTYDYNHANLLCIAWSPELELFVISGNYGIWTTPDLITWTTVIDPNILGYALYALVWSSDLSLFIGIGYGQSFTSPDGVSWTANGDEDLAFGHAMTVADMLPPGPAPISIHASTRSHSPIFNLAPIGVGASAKSRHLRFNLSPISIEASGVSKQPGSLSAYTGEPHDILMSVLLTGRITADFPAPVPPVDFGGIPDPTVAPICVASDTTEGHLLSGTYRYAYAAWVGDIGQSTAPSPWSEPVTLGSEDTVTLTYPTIDGADGYTVYRREMT